MTRSAENIECIDARFLRDATNHSRPVVVRGLAHDWPARNWTLASLQREYGTSRVKVTKLRDHAVQIDPRVGIVFEDQTLGPFLDALMHGNTSEYLMMATRDLPIEMQRALPIPDVCASTRTRDSKLWISPTGATSALHFDVQKNLHTVLVGSKQFLVYPPSDALVLYPRGPFSSVPNGAWVDPERPDLVRFPRFSRAKPSQTVVRSGETIFVPPGWWHYVRTLENTIAANTWWTSGLGTLVARAASIYKHARGVSR